ncbi:MAG: hypothetical protein KAW41_06180 [Candidatus Diapherotrites archaeon]|nr:hypothetical protein [Candidatus Diapherotrites archaeon]
MARKAGPLPRRVMELWNAKARIPGKIKDVVVSTAGKLRTKKVIKRLNKSKNPEHRKLAKWLKKNNYHVLDVNEEFFSSGFKDSFLLYGESHRNEEMARDQAGLVRSMKIRRVMREGFGPKENYDFSENPFPAPYTLRGIVEGAPEMLPEEDLNRLKKDFKKTFSRDVLLMDRFENTYESTLGMFREGMSPGGPPHPRFPGLEKEVRAEYKKAGWKHTGDIAMDFLKRLENGKGGKVLKSLFKKYVHDGKGVESHVQEHVLGLNTLPGSFDELMDTPFYAWHPAIYDALKKGKYVPSVLLSRETGFGELVPTRTVTGLSAYLDGAENQNERLDHAMQDMRAANLGVEDLGLHKKCLMVLGRLQDVSGEKKKEKKYQAKLDKVLADRETAFFKNAMMQVKTTPHLPGLSIILMGVEHAKKSSNVNKRLKRRGVGFISIRKQVPRERGGDFLYHLVVAKEIMKK